MDESSYAIHFSQVISSNKKSQSIVDDEIYKFVKYSFSLSFEMFWNQENDEFLELLL